MTLGNVHSLAAYAQQSAEVCNNNHAGREKSQRRKITSPSHIKLRYVNLLDESDLRTLRFLSLTAKGISESRIKMETAAVNKR